MQLPHPETLNVEGYLKLSKQSTDLRLEVILNTLNFKKLYYGRAVGWIVQKNADQV
jgi:hypothetical protein